MSSFHALSPVGSPEASGSQERAPRVRPPRDDNPFLSPSSSPVRRRRAAPAANSTRFDLDDDNDAGLDDMAGLGAFDPPGPGPAKAHTRLQNAWVAERAAPELLRWEGALVDEVCGDIENCVRIMEELAPDEGTSAEEHVRLGIVALDIERARWLVRSYVRTRIAKVELFSAHLASSAEARRNLSDLERSYAEKFQELQDKHLRASVADFLPPSLRGLDVVEGSQTGAGSMIITPDIDAPVFIRCRVDCGEVRINAEGENAQLRQGSIHLLRYRIVRRLIASGHVEML